MKSYLSLTLVVLALCAGCRTTPVQPTKPAAHPTGAPAAAAVAARPIPQLGAPTLLTGKVKLISDRGGAVVSNNGSGAISDNGAGAISDNGAGVISNNGSGLAAAKAGHMVIRVLAAAPTETLLADARIEVLDATGATLGDENGRPLVATSGRDGSFQLRAVLPPEAVVLRVRLSTAVVRKGGELRAIVARDAGNATLDLDTAASLGAGYVLERLVKGQVGVLERLPAQNARDLKTAITAALTAESRPSDYAPAALAGQVAVLREANEGVRTELERIEAILLAGVSNLGVGLPATAVALIDPQAVTSDGTGGLLIAERTTGRIRQLKADGTMALYTDALDGRFKVGFGTITQIRRAADGALYVAQQGPSGVQRLLPDGRLEPLIGAGAQAGGPDVEPNTIALAADGTLWIGQAYPRGILSRAPDGQVAPLPWPDTFPAGGQVVALELATDGVLWALWVPDDANTGPFSGRLARRDPAGSWQMVAGALGCASRGGLAADSAGAMLVAADREHKVWRIASDGTRSLVAGTGEIGDEGDGGAATAARLTNPHGLWRAEDGSVYVVEPVSGVVRAIAPDGKIRTAAGARGVVRVGGAVRVALAAPTGV
ncbi:MAG: hypothetical protein JWM80_4262, partial [Cyanobacteria bacterium RYN_339]|nr:hypothetical protein [Cyanobacteria bacterium RYN_339]